MRHVSHIYRLLFLKLLLRVDVRVSVDPLLLSNPLLLKPHLNVILRSNFPLNFIKIEILFADIHKSLLLYVRGLHFLRRYHFVIPVRCVLDIRLKCLRVKSRELVDFYHCSEFDRTINLHHRQKVWVLSVFYLLVDHTISVVLKFCVTRLYSKLILYHLVGLLLILRDI